MFSVKNFYVNYYQVFILIQSKYMVSSYFCLLIKALMQIYLLLAARTGIIIWNNWNNNILCKIHAYFYNIRINNNVTA